MYSTDPDLEDREVGGRGECPGEMMSTKTTPEGVMGNQRKEEQSARHSILFLMLLGIVLHLISIATPGYFNHDEVQMCIASRDLWNSIETVWVNQIDYRHWRSLSWSLWLLLSHFFCEIPVVMHLSVALLVIISGVLFYFLLLRISGQALASIMGFVAFCIFPATVWVSGWVGTIADAMWMISALVIAHVLLTDRKAAEFDHGGGYIMPKQAARQLYILLLFVIGLLSKENFIVLPAALAGLLVFTRPWNGLLLAILSTGTVAAIYLLLRLDILLSGDGQYSVSARNIFYNIWLYWQFPWNLKLSSIHSPPMSRIPIWVGLSTLVSFAPVMYLVLRRQWRFAAAIVFYYFIFLSPALLIPGTYAHYMFGAALPIAATFSYSFRQEEHRFIKWASLTLLSILFFHSVMIQFKIYSWGQVQTRIYDTISSIVVSHDRRSGHQRTQFVIISEKGSKDYIMRSALNHVNTIGSIPIKGRIKVYSYLQEPQQASLDAVTLVLTSTNIVIER